MQDKPIALVAGGNKGSVANREDLAVHAFTVLIGRATSSTERRGVSHVEKPGSSLEEISSSWSAAISI